MKPIHLLVDQALTAAEHAKEAKDKNLDPREHIHRANDILKYQIPKVDGFRDFLMDKKNPFLEIYAQLLQQIDLAKWPDPVEHEPAAPSLQDRFAKIRRKPVGTAPNEASAPLSQAKPRTRPPIPQTTPKIAMPEPAINSRVQMPEPPPPPVQPLRSKHQISEVSPHILHNLLLENPDSILIIDIRDRVSFNSFHIDAPHIVCLEFFGLSPGMTEKDLEESLMFAPEADQIAFLNLHSVQLIVLVDESDSPHREKLEIVKAALKNAKKVVELSGGTEAWISRNYPTISTPVTPAFTPEPSLSPELAHATVSRETSEPPSHSPFAHSAQLSRDGTLFVRHGAIQDRPRAQSPVRPAKLVEYPSVASGSKYAEHPQRPPHVPQAASYTSPSALNGHHGGHLGQNSYPSGYPNNNHNGFQTHQQRPPSVPSHAYHLNSHPTPAMQPQPELIAGLKNLGNTCYMNCVLQCLFGTTEVITPFLDGTYQKYINPKSRLGYSGRLAHEFARLVLSVAHTRQGYVAPFELKQLAGQLQETFLGYDQQDCQEFLTFILDGLHEDLNSRGDAPHAPPLTDEQERVREQFDIRVAAAIEWERYMGTNASLIVDELQGQYASRLECTVCHTTSTTYTAFSTLTLPLVHTKRPGSVDLLECFKAFLAPETLDGDNAWFCPKCKRKQKAVQYLKISRLPKILIIHLKRFRQKRSFSGGISANKLEASVKYPLYHLDLTKFWTPVHELSDHEQNILSNMPQRSQGPPFIYDLYAVTAHHGSLKSGHYTACVRKESHGWFYFDDTNVVPLRDNNVVTRNAYVLFYRRRRNF